MGFDSAFSREKWGSMAQTEARTLESVRIWIALGSAGERACTVAIWPVRI